MTAMREKEGIPHSLQDQRLRPKLASTTEEIQMGREKLRVGTMLDEELRTRLIKTLDENQDLFGKDITDLNGISRDLS